MKAGRGSRLAVALPWIVALACHPAERPGSEGGVASSAPCRELTAGLCEAAGSGTPTCAELASALRLLPDSACRAGLADVAESIRRIEARAARCATLVERLCGDLGRDSTACQRVRADAASLPSDRCEMMLVHYEATLASIRAEDAAAGPLDAEQQRAIAAGPAPGFGPDDAAVTIVEFVDFQCPFCARAAPVVARLRARFGDRVRFVVRQFPLDFHANARLAAEAALAAHEQGRFWELHDRLYAHQDSLDRPTLDRLAAEAGLDVERFQAALDSRRFAAAVEADLALGRDAVVDGTPTLFVNGVRVEDPGDYAAIERLVRGAGGD